jgi:tetratricopeptide (TPR) repeat protein
MPALSLAAAVAALAALAPPAAPKQSWDATMRPEGYAAFLPHTAAVEVDGKVVGRGSVQVEVTDPARRIHLRVSADGFEPEEATVEAGRVADREFMVVLRPAGWTKRLDPRDASATALAAADLWRAGHVDAAAEYADYSLRLANTPLANRVLGDVWRKRGDREKATQYYTKYLSISENAAEKEEIRAWLMQDRPGDITIPAK